ncbi:MAG: Crp/Fnr family transcriptional regulator [Pseudoruegeria sp.]
MKLSNKYQYLRPTLLLNGIPAPLANQYLDDCREVVSVKTTALLNEGGEADNVVLVAHGVVEVSNLTRQGEKVVANHAGPGDVLGDVEVLGELPVICTCIAQPNTVTLHCPKDRFFEFAKHPTALRNLTRIQAERLMRGIRFKEIDQFRSVSQRVGHYIGHLSRFSGKVGQNQSYLANLVGCSRQTVNREISGLKTAGVVSVDPAGDLRVDRIALVEWIERL